jgi:tetratricopeptide (TPR) repeat protein
VQWLATRIKEGTVDPNGDDYGVERQSKELPFQSWRPVLVGVLMAFLVVGLAGLGGIIWHRPRPLTADQVPEQSEPEVVSAGNETPKRAAPRHGASIDDEDKAAAADLNAAAIGQLELADAAAARGDWPKAAREYKKITDNLRVPLIVWHCRAAASLKSGDSAGYRKVCDSLLGRVALTPQNVQGVNTVAWICAIGPEASADPERPVMLANFLLAHLPDDTTLRHAYLNTIGAVYLRAGRFDDAVKHLMDGIAAAGDEGSPQDWLLLALACHHLGRADEARHWFAVKQANPPPDRPGAFWDRAEIELLRDEANRTISPM